MSNWITLPDGNAISTVVIKSVVLYPGRGVMCRDAQQRIAAWIKVDDVEKGERVRDIMIRCAKGGNAQQPIWQFMKEGMAETLSAPDLPPDIPVSKEPPTETTSA